jgi:cis-3-alkyl-4-acyloxetan-2-one decarboxylase
MVGPERFATSDYTLPHSNLRMAYRSEGTGDPIVCVHGNPTYSYYFRSIFENLSQQYRVVAPDHIGCGDSDKPTLAQYSFRLQDRIDDLEALLNHLTINERVTLVLHDWGGMIGLGWAARHPGRVKRIIAINTGCTRLPAAKPFPWSLWLGRNTALGAWLILNRNYFVKKAAEWCVARRPLPPEVRAQYFRPYPTPASRLSVLKFVQTIPLRPTDEGMDIVEQVEASLTQYANIPTLLLWGLKDYVFDRHFYEEWRRRFPHAEAHAWPDCSHYLLEDAGAEAIMRMARFLSERPILEE